MSSIIPRVQETCLSQPILQRTIRLVHRVDASRNAAADRLENNIGRTKFPQGLWTCTGSIIYIFPSQRRMG